MIEHRHKWLLRDTAACFDSHHDDLGWYYLCRLCRVQEHQAVRFVRHDLERHLGAHRREKVLPEVRPEDLA